MRILNDIAYADNYNSENLKVTDIEIISELCMLVTFSNEEKMFCLYLLSVYTFS